MKTKLLILFLFFSSITFAQIQGNGIYSQQYTDSVKTNFKGTSTTGSIIYKGGYLYKNDAGGYSILGGSSVSMNYGNATIRRKAKSDTTITNIELIMNTTLFPDADSISVIVNEGANLVTTIGLYRASIRVYDINGRIIRANGTGYIWDMTGNLALTSSKGTGQIFGTSGIVNNTTTASYTLKMSNLTINQTGASSKVYNCTKVSYNYIDNNHITTSGTGLYYNHDNYNSIDKITNNYIKSTNSHCIYISEGGQCEISGNIFEHTATEYAIYILGDGTIVDISANIATNTTNSLDLNTGATVSGVYKNVNVRYGYYLRKTLIGSFSTITVSSPTPVYVSGTASKLVVSANNGEIDFNGILNPTASDFLSITGANSKIKVSGEIVYVGWYTLTTTAGTLEFNGLKFRTNPTSDSLLYENMFTHTGTFKLVDIKANFSPSVTTANTYLFSVNGTLDMQDCHLRYDNRNATAANDTTAWVFKFAGNSNFIDRGGNVLIADSNSYAVNNGAFTITRYGVGSSSAQTHKPFGTTWRKDFYQGNAFIEKFTNNNLYMNKQDYLYLLKTY